MVEQIDELAALVLDDPQRANLREVLWEECVGDCLNHLGTDCDCNLCQGTGWSRRKWDGPDWWLENIIGDAGDRDGLGLFLRVEQYGAMIAALKVKA